MIPLESDHFQGSALCKFLWENGEIAIRKEGDFEFVETRDVFWEAAEWVVGQVEDLQGVEKGEDFSWEAGEVAGELEPFCALVVAGFETLESLDDGHYVYAKIASN